MSYTIRKAEASDMASVLRLVNELAIHENEADAVEVTVDDLIAHGTGENPDFTCFVADSTEEGIVGIALTYFRFSTWKGKTVHLEDLVVKENKRGEGIGMALYSEVISFAYKHDVRRVEWVVVDDNHGAIGFYEASGAHVMKNWHTVQMHKEGMKKFLKDRGKI